MFYIFPKGYFLKPIYEIFALRQKLLTGFLFYGMCFMQKDDSNFVSKAYKVRKIHCIFDNFNNSCHVSLGCNEVNWKNV